MRYIVIERYTHGPAPIYARAAERGRMLPAGLTYIESWVDERLDRCFQLMETDDPGLFAVDRPLERPGQLRGGAGAGIGGGGGTGGVRLKPDP